MFEQVLFYTFARHEGKYIETIFTTKKSDNGYRYDEFCDFLNFESQPMLHFLGGFKRNERACNLLVKKLLQISPSYFERILRNCSFSSRLSCFNSLSFESRNNQECLSEYIDYMNMLVKSWKDISTDKLLELERKSTYFFDFYNMPFDLKRRIKLVANPYLSFFRIPDYWPQKAKDLVVGRISQGNIIYAKDIVQIPVLLNAGYKEIVIDDLEFNILWTLHHIELTIDGLNELLEPLVDNSLKTKYCDFSKYLAGKIEKLMLCGLICASELPSNTIDKF